MAGHFNNLQAMDNYCRKTFSFDIYTAMASKITSYRKHQQRQLQQHDAFKFGAVLSHETTEWHALSLSL